MATAYSILGACRLGATRLGYHSGVFYMQIGRRLSPARLGACRLGATRLGQTTLYSALSCFEPDSLKISQQQGNLPSLNVTVKRQYTTRPAAGDPVIVGVGTLKNRLFLGRIGRLTEPEKAGFVSYDLDCDHVTKDLEGVKVFETFTAKYAADILQTLFADYTLGYFWRGSNAQGAYYSSIEYRGTSLYQIAQDLATDSAAQFYIDNNKRIYFDTPIERNVADLADPPRYELDLKIQEDCREFISQVIMLYSDVSDITQNFKGDGTKKEFTMSLKAQSVTSLTVDGVAVTWGIRNKQDNSTNDFSIDLDGATIYTSAHATLTSSQTLSITYRGKVPARLTVTDANAKAAWASLTGTPGIVSRVEENRSIISKDDAQEAAENLLLQYARIYYDADYAVRKSLFTLPDLRVGDKQIVTARGRTLAMQIQQIDISVYVPGSGAALYLEYAVKLGERSYAIENDLKRVERKTNTTTDQVITTVEI